MSRPPRVVVIGAGIVGCSLADELTERGWTDVTVLDRGPLFATGGSSSHAPGLVFSTNPSKTMTELAAYTTAKLGGLDLDGRPCFRAVGGLEVATTEERWADLHRKAGWAASWGVEAALVDPAACARLHPLLDPGAVLGGLHTPRDGIASALRAGEAQARRATARGARFLGEHEVTEVLQHAGRVTGVRTAHGQVPADVVVCAAGFWGPAVGALVGLDVPLLPLAHQYARTGQVAALAGGQGGGGAAADPDGARLPILRHQDRDLYFREHGDRLGIGSYGHRPMPVRLEELDDARTAMPSVQPFTDDDFADAWEASAALLPELAETKVDSGINGIFSFTPDGAPLVGEHPDLAGFWLAEAVWVTHSAGVARALAQWLVDGQPATDLHECDLHRFTGAQTTPAHVAERGARAFVEVYDVRHPLEPSASTTGVLRTPFHDRQVALGAVFGDAGGWARPQWFEANAPLLHAPGQVAPPPRDTWSARHWSPVAAAEARATRERVAVYDMTPLTRYEVRGPGALAMLQSLTTNDLARRVGAVTYALMLGADGGVRSDVTVARLGEERFQVGANGPVDGDWLRRHLPADGSVSLTETTETTCCLGLWGPAARGVLAPLTEGDVSHAGLPYFRAAALVVAGLPVTALRVSYVGELGWELYTPAEHGPALWDALFDAGRAHGLVAAGRSAFTSLRLEKGYRAWGTDVTTEHDPYEAGLGFAVRLDRGDFVGRAALERRSADTAARRLTCLTLDDPARVVMGSEPVRVDGRVAGYVTSAAHGYTVGRTVAYAWLPAAASVPGRAVSVEYFGEQLAATVAAEPLVDPGMERIRR